MKLEKKIELLYFMLLLFGFPRTKHQKQIEFHDPLKILLESPFSFEFNCFTEFYNPDTLNDMRKFNLESKTVNERLLCIVYLEPQFEKCVVIKASFI